MSSPYWGNLPVPKISTRPNHRNFSENDSSRNLTRQPMDSAASNVPQSRSNRASTQTTATEAPTESTSSPNASPRVSSLNGYGLSPRPVSQGKLPPDVLEKRRRRASKTRDDDEAYSGASALPPAAPDVPNAPPVSYRHPYGNGGLPYTVPKAGADQEPDILPSPGVIDPDRYMSPATDRPRRSDTIASTTSGRRVSSASASSTRNGGGRDSVNGHRKASLGGEADRRLFADARSPLQRLELTLDSITKEEKRARVQAAERNVRERAARGRSKEDVQPHTVRFQDAAAGTELDLPGNQGVAETVPAQHAVPPNNEHTVHDQQQKSQRHGSQTGKSTRPRVVIATPIYDEVAHDPHRNLSFRERAARHDIDLSKDEHESGFSLTRNGSNKKLTKNPPGHTGGYRRDKKLDRTLPDQKRGPSQPPGPDTAALPATVGPPQKVDGRSVRNKVPPLSIPESRRRPVAGHDVSVDDLDSPITTGRSAGSPVRGRVSPSGRAPSRSPFPPTSGSHQNIASKSTTDHKAAAGAAAGTIAVLPERHHQSPSASEDGDHSDDGRLFSERFHRHEYKPGHGLYDPPKYLDEWRKGPVGTLSGGMLELEDDTDPTLKDQTWWETPPSQRRGSMSSRPRKAEAFDGEYDETNGTQNSYGQADHIQGQDNGSQRLQLSWSIHYDDVVPSARKFLGHQVTADKRKARRQSRLYSIGRSLDASNGSLDPNCLSTLCSCSPCLSLRRQRQPSENALLTRSARMAIRVPNPIAPTRFKPALHLKCGPLLRYCGTRVERITGRSARNGPAIEREFWRGTVMIVTADEDSSYPIAPTLRLFAQPIELLPPPPAEIRGEVPAEYVDPIAGHPKLGRKGETLYVRPAYDLKEGKDLSRDDSDEGLFEKTRSPPDVDLPEGSTDAPGSFADRKRRSPIDGEKVGKYKDVRGYRLHAERGYTFWRFSIEVEIRDKEQRIAYRINRGPATGFWVPAKDQSMNIMFHSCNGFSLSVNPDELSGPDPLWRDVLNNHQSRPFHVMIGGGDQLYCDAVMRQTKIFQSWLMIRNPLQKHNAPFTPEMQDELEAFYLERYCMWFSQGLFGLANSQIPMVNIYDDHDIIDGFGSYPHHFMCSPVFSGLGNVAFKYYMLFQHQSVPDETEETEPSWVLGVKPGPYIHELSRSCFMKLGSKIALLAVDCRTERMRDQVLQDDTWDKLMDRCYNEIVKGKTEHLLVLLGVPIAYPRLVWLENILTSRLLDPIKALGKTGLFGNVFNKFDGGVEVLDDLDDHWTAKSHKDERKILIQDLQDLAADRSVRITILSGDVHLAAIGQFYSNPKLDLQKHKDFRYMPNVISSAIVNTPPPDLMADVLNKRNKVHHLDKDTDEDMVPMFALGVEGKPRNNKRLLPHRNWCSIREYSPGQTPISTPADSLHEGQANVDSPGGPIGKGVTRRLSKRNRGPAHRADVIDSRPPVSGGGTSGLFRSLSSRGRRPSTSDAPADSQRPVKTKRTMSLTRGELGLFRRSSKTNKRSVKDDGGINGTWGDSDPEDDGRDAHHDRGEYYDEDDYKDRRFDRGHGFLGAIGLRGGGGSYDEFSEGDDSYFTTRAPANTGATRAGASKTARLLGDEAPPTSTRRIQGHQQPRGYGTTTTVTGPGTRASVDFFNPQSFEGIDSGPSAKQQLRVRKDTALDFKQGGLDICLNVEVSAKDPSGITVPYKLLVPRLWYDAAEGEQVEMPERREGGVKRLLSLNRGKSVASKGKASGEGAGLRKAVEWQQERHREEAIDPPAPGTAF